VGNVFGENGKHGVTPVPVPSIEDIAMTERTQNYELLLAADMPLGNALKRLDPSGA